MRRAESAVTVKLPPPLEAEVQRACLALLKARGVLMFRSNNRVLRVPGKGGRSRLMTAGLGKGSADSIGLLPGGRFIAVEFKRPGERPTPEQIGWLRGVNRAGGLGVWVDGLDAMTTILDLLSDPTVCRLTNTIDDDATQRLRGEEFGESRTK